MGAFGFRNFENDTALDWVDGFAERKSLKRLESDLKKYAGKSEEAEAVLAIAEVIAAIRGRASKDCPEEVRIWTSKSKWVIGKPLVQAAIKAIESIVANSELRELWAETSDQKAWTNVQLDLLLRLRSEPIKPIPVEAQRKRLELCLWFRSRKGAMTSSSAIYLRNPAFSGTSLEKLRTQRDTHLEIDLSEDYTTDEIEKIAKWANRHPGQTLMFNEDGFARPLNFLLETLSQFSRSWRIVLNLKTKDIGECVDCFTNLKELTIASKKAKGILPLLRKRKGLKVVEFAG